MVPLIFILMFTLAFPSSITGGEQEDKIIIGQDIKRCRELMKDFGNGDRILQWEIKTPDTGFNMWSIPEGVLVVFYGTKNDMITGMIYYISEGKEKAERLTKTFTVIEFYPAPRKITLSLIDRR